MPQLPHRWLRNLLTLAGFWGAVGGCRSPSSPPNGGAMAGSRRDGTTSSACTHEAADPIARALCATPAPALHGLVDLYRALDLETPLSQRLTSATTHSLGLSGRITSAINPRVFVFSSYVATPDGLTRSRIAVTAFNRGEQMVELVGFDPVARDFNFYLLRFEQACNQFGCTPADLLTEKIEMNWTRWTLQADRDLEDTPSTVSPVTGPTAARRASAS